MQLGDILSLLGTFLGFILILVLAAWSVRLLSRGYSTQSRGKMIQVVERIGLGTDKQLLIVKAAGRAYLLGVTAQHIEKIEELDPDELPDVFEPGKDGAFLDMFKKALTPRTGKESSNERGADTREA